MVTSIWNMKGHILAFQEVVAVLMRQRLLTLELARREIVERYLGQVFGTLWALGHPLIMMGIYVVIFTFVFKIRIGGTRDLPLDYTTYLLAGLIPWFSFQDSMNKATTVIVGSANLVKQVVFPLEVLPVKGVVASLMTQVIFLLLMMIYVLATHHALPWTYSLLPILLALQVMAMAGVAYILSAVGVYFRDIKDIVQAFSMAGMYLLPILYLPSFVPEPMRPLLYVNPFSYLIWCYQDALYYGRFEHPWAWLILVLLSVSVFVLGYRLFRKLSTMFGNVL